MSQTIYLTDTQGCFTESVTFDPLQAIPRGAVFVAPPATTGDEVAQWAGDVWRVLASAPVPAATPVPQSVTMRQARLALLAAGLLQNVQSAISSLAEPDKSKAQIEWEYSNALERNNPFVAVLGAALGLNSAALDALFIQAAAL